MIMTNNEHVWIRIVLGGLCVCLHSLHFCFNFCRNKLWRLRAILKFGAVGSALLAFSLLDTIPTMPCAAAPRLFLLVSLGQATASTTDYRYSDIWFFAVYVFPDLSQLSQISCETLSYWMSAFRVSHEVASSESPALVNLPSGPCA